VATCDACGSGISTSASPALLSFRLPKLRASFLQLVPSWRSFFKSAVKPCNPVTRGVKSLHGAGLNTVSAGEKSNTWT
jgi:hypothetical protein